ncbi:hypothetical protein [Streptomyces sp. KR80]|uniref:hypothetical protein n=1 Tax=Streptomyces sp. KR80 TaxID=3457426 RepID=UPI003FD195E7
MRTDETSRFVRLGVELVLQVTDKGELTGAAFDRIGEDEFMPDEERGHARSAVRDDTAEALSYLVDPVDLVRGVPGVELAQASWSSELVDYDPEAAEWGLGDFDDLDDLDEKSEGDEELDGFEVIREDEDQPQGEGGARRA